MFSSHKPNYRQEVEFVGNTTEENKEAILASYERKSALSDEHNKIFDSNRARANELYSQILKEEEKLDALKEKSGVQLRFKR